MTRSIDDAPGPLLRLRNRVEAVLVQYCLGSAPSGAEFEAMVTDVAKCFPKTILRQTLGESLQHLAGEESSSAVLYETAWRLAANLRELRRRMPVSLRPRPSDDDWALIQILEAHRDRRKRGPGYRFKMQVVTGPYAPGLITKFWSLKYCHLLARRFGFTSSYRAYPFRDGLEFTLMRFDAFIEQRLSINGPDFEQILEAQLVPPSCYRHNRKLLQYRARQLPHTKCPRDYPRDHACFSCPVGYDQCGVGTHPKTYVDRPCPACHDDEAPFEPDATERCVNCENREAWKPIKAAK